jgi:hypothetical protein
MCDHISHGLLSPTDINMNLDARSDCVNHLNGFCPCSWATVLI